MMFALALPPFAAACVGGGEAGPDSVAPLHPAAPAAAHAARSLAARLKVCLLSPSLGPMRLWKFRCLSILNYL